MRAREIRFILGCDERVHWPRIALTICQLRIAECGLWIEKIEGRFPERLRLANATVIELVEWSIICYTFRCQPM